MEYFNFLPKEITLNIISRLPAEDVLECKLVCTNWRDLVRNPSFSKMHLNHHEGFGKLGFIALTVMDGKNYNTFRYLEYDENLESIEKITRFNFDSPFREDTIFLGSCNGLICLYQSIYLPGKTFYSFSGKTYICNPITREYVLLPEIRRVGIYHMASGFGYVSSTNEYKVVMLMLYKNIQLVEVFVYTVGSGNGWRNLGNFNLGTRTCVAVGYFAEEVLYWLDYDSEMMIPFDLAEEKFSEHLSLPFPPDYDSNDSDDCNYKLGVLDGCLSFGLNLPVNGAECWHVWLLKKVDHQGVKQQEVHHSLEWGKVFRFYDDGYWFAVMKSSTVLTYDGNWIYIHDLESSTSKTVVEFEEEFINVVPHKNTFVSLKELGEEDTKIMESVKNEETEERHDQSFNHL